MADLSSTLPDTSTKDFKKDLLAKIKQLDGLTDVERAELVKLLNDTKKYGLIWEDKPEAAEELLRTKLPVLREVVERRILSETEFTELKNEQNKTIVPQQSSLFSEEKAEIIEPILPGNPPNHILIEGDNLHALTALTFTHEGKIDVIYIDPPYNTGNKDFKYNDSFVDKEDSYRHSKWLSFMHKRLKIAKRLLSDKGVIFISIDDNENAQLKLLCDDIFSETNFISDVIWQARKSVSNDTIVSLNHNYTFIYAKEISKISKRDFRLPTISEKFNNPDNDSRGSWIADPFDAPNLRPNLTYAIVNPNNGKIFWPPKGRCWRTSEDEYLKFLADNRIVFGKKGKTKPQLKRFLDFAQDKGSTPISIWYDIETTTNGTQQLEQILGSKLFTNPKPLGLIDRILKLSTKNNTPYIILDFFAGSGTTLQATMQLNAEDGGNRQCILVTNNENNICEEVTYERNRRVIQGYTNAKGNWVEGLKNNNLRYYQIDFVDSAKTEVNRRKLTILSTNLLQIKEECYLDITEAEGFDCSKCSIHSNEQGKYMMVIYHSRTQIETTELLSNWIASRTDLSEKLKIYAFGHETEIIVDDFYAVSDKIDAVPLPDAIYNAYRATFRTLKLDKKAPVTNFELLQTTTQPEEN
jgi:adenine-specific DNA-methyltransferase